MDVFGLCRGLLVNIKSTYRVRISFCCFTVILIQFLFVEDGLTSCASGRVFRTLLPTSSFLPCKCRQYVPPKRLKTFALLIRPQNPKVKRKMYYVFREFLLFPLTTRKTLLFTILLMNSCLIQ